MLRLRATSFRTYSRSLADIYSLFCCFAPFKVVFPRSRKMSNAPAQHGVRSGGSGDARDVDNYQPLDGIHHDTHKRAVEERLAQPNVKMLDKSLHPLEPIMDKLNAGEKVIVELNDGRHRGRVIEDVCSVEEMEAGSWQQHASGTTLDERVYRVSYIIVEGGSSGPHGVHGGAGGGLGGKEKEKSALFKRSDLRREQEVLDKEGSLGIGHYSQATVPKEGRFLANSTQRRSPTRREVSQVITILLDRASNQVLISLLACWFYLFVCSKRRWPCTGGLNRSGGQARR
jgi:hypothetical protein